MNLLKQKCAPCEGGEPLPRSESQAYLTELKGWTLHQKSLEQDFLFKDFKESMQFVNKVADIAEKEGHHPDIYIFYKKVHLQLSTHAVGGLSVNDFILAAKIDQLL